MMGARWTAAVKINMTQNVEDNLAKKYEDELHILRNSCSTIVLVL